MKTISACAGVARAAPLDRSNARERPRRYPVREGANLALKTFSQKGECWMLLTGVWAATQTTIVDRRWVPRPPDSTTHYFLVVSSGDRGGVTAFIRNPEANIGAFLGDRSVIVDGPRLTLERPSHANVTGFINEDGTLTLQKVAADGGDIRFHRATPTDLRWFYPDATGTWRYRQPTVLNDGWRVGSLSSVGMQLAPIGAVLNEIVADRQPTLQSPYIQSVAISRHGKLVLDEYFYGFSEAYPHDVRSAGKSVTGLILGRAIEDTRTFGVASPVLPLLPQFRDIRNDDARKQRMTIGDLLTMASGLACDDNDDASPGNEDTMQSQPPGTDWYEYTLDLPMMHEPGTFAVYCSAGINLLGAVIQTQTHVALSDYFEQRFAAPMEFQTYNLWLMPPPASAAYMAGGDRMRPRDFLKFGELLLDRGRWNERQIVDPNWIAQSMLPRTAPIGEGDRFGYGWHVTSVTVASRSYTVVGAGGNGGQLMLAVPQLDLAMMLTAGNYGQYAVWGKFLREFATAAIESCL
jgi:CubicO group peptidase (beta-lactamase class C family)